ncbi:MAG: extracellular solute-binding protein [Nitrospinae bacterium]|nr:extracellular solute-binding protein [Nitrospinota bacterium]
MNYLPELIDRFNREQHTTAEAFPDGTKQPIHLEALTVNSGTMSEYLIRKIRDKVDFPTNVPAPHVVSPSVDHWLSRVNFVTGVPVFDLDSTKDLALSPVVIAMYEEMARALGWPQKPLGWEDIIALAQSPDGWAKYPLAKVEWGRKPLLAWTDPFVSSTARSALFAAYVAAAQKPADQLSVADVHRSDVQAYIRQLQGAVDHYFPETLKLQTKIFNGPRFVHFAPLEEYMLPWMKLGLVNSESIGGKVEKRALDRKMVAIYPKEGTLWHNNPGGIVQNVPWTAKDKQQAARMFIDYLLRRESQEKAMEWGFRPANPAVPYGPYLSPEYGIDPKQPKALLGRIKPDLAEEIMNTWQDVKKPGVVVLVMDLSGSMGSPGKLDRAREGAKRFLDAMTPQTYVGLVTFSDTVHEENLVPVAPLTDNRFRIAEIIDKARAQGGTALFDAVKRGIELVQGAKLKGSAIRGVVLLTDGMRNTGRVKLSDLVRLTTRKEEPVGSFEGDEKQRKEHLVATELALPAREPIHIFSIGYGNDADWEVLRLLSEATNSTFNRASEKDLAEVLERFGKYF